MIVTLTRGLKVDTDNIPDNLPKMVHKAFAEFTEGTAKSYQYQDKLSFIDLMIEKLHCADVSVSEKVNKKN